MYRYDNGRYAIKGPTPPPTNNKNNIDTPHPRNRKSKAQTSSNITNNQKFTYEAILPTACKMTKNLQLSDYLNEKLPYLSLDPETYIPYIIGCLETFQDDDELDEIIDLLQASSESHSDDEEIWPKLKQDILQKHHEYKEEEERLKKEEDEERREMEARKKKEELEEINRERERKRLADEEKAKKNELDPAKQALLQQYAYDISETYDNDGKVVDVVGGGAKKEGDEVGANNREVAAKMNKERAQQIRGAHNTSKNDERAKTKQAKIDKMKKKEDRRNRAQKGERKR